MKKTFLLILIILSLFIIGCKEETNTREESSNGTDLVIEKPKSSNIDRTFIISGKNFKFEMNGKENPEINVKEGEKIRIEFSSSEGFHDWIIDEFNARTEKASVGTPTSVEFTANKKGTFEYYCSVGSHRANGMKGKLIVE